LPLRQARAARHIEKQCYPGIELVDILPTRTTAARGLEDKLIFINTSIFGYVNHCFNFF